MRCFGSAMKRRPPLQRRGRSKSKSGCYIGHCGDLIDGGLLLLNRKKRGIACWMVECGRERRECVWGVVDLCEGDTVR